MCLRRVVVIAATLSLAAVACKRGGGDDTCTTCAPGVDAGTFDKAALLQAFGQCALDGYREVRTSAVELDAATRRAEAEGTPAARDAAREAWKKTIDAWQRAELFAFGPAATSPAPGAKDLRDPIYSWPLVNRCLIEQQLLDKVYEKPELTTALVNTRGLAAEEYLLFYDGADNGCPPTATMNTSGAWAALGAPEIAKRKNAHARALATDTLQRVDTLVAAWDPAQGNFLGAMTNTGSGQPFASQQMAFNAVSNAFFYVDDFMKNMKLGKPAGLFPGCAAPPCLNDLESQWAKRSKEHLKNNLAGFDKLLRGCGPGNAGLGWDDLLIAVGDQALATKLTDAVLATRAALEDLKEPSLADDLQKNPAGVKKVYDALRTIVVLLKTEFISILDLELPKRVEGDND